MKLIKYRVMSEVNRVIDAEPQIEQVISGDRWMTFSDKNLEIVKETAYNGEYTIEDDGQPEPEPTEQEQRVSDLEEQLAQSDETAIALYEAQEEQEVINAQQDEALMELYEMIG